MDNDDMPNNDDVPPGFRRAGAGEYHLRADETGRGRANTTGRQQPVVVEDHHEANVQVPASVQQIVNVPQQRQVESTGAKFADRLGQSVFVVCLTYLALNDKIPGMAVVYAGIGVVGGVELLRMLTRVRLVGAGTAIGAIGLLMASMLVASPLPALIAPVYSLTLLAHGTHAPPR